MSVAEEKLESFEDPKRHRGKRFAEDAPSIQSLNFDEHCIRSSTNSILKRSTNSQIYRVKHLNMLLEEQRFLHEDLERLEAAIGDRLGDEPKQVRALHSNYKAQTDIACSDQRTSK